MKSSVEQADCSYKSKAAHMQYLLRFSHWQEGTKLCSEPPLSHTN